jgi:MYXO-CTERM domain-containing protein
VVLSQSSYGWLNGLAALLVVAMLVVGQRRNLPVETPQRPSGVS